MIERRGPRNWKTLNDNSQSNDPDTKGRVKYVIQHDPGMAETVRTYLNNEKIDGFSHDAYTTTVIINERGSKKIIKHIQNSGLRANIQRA